VIGLAMITTWVVLLHQDWLPVFLVMGEGLTPAKITLEWLLIGLTALTLALVWRKREGITLYEPRCLVLALWLTGLSELCFTLYSDAADVFSLAGHIFKVVSYGFLYKSIIAGSVKLPYKLLAQTRAATQQLVDNIQEVFWMTSVDKQQVFFVSPAYETIWRRSCESLMESPLSWLDAVHPEDRERVERTLPLQASGGYSLEYRIIRPDGSERWIRDKAFPIYDENGEVLRVAGIADDITEQVSAAETLYKKERMLNQTQAIAHLGSWELDLENNHLTWSDEAYRIFGLTSQDVTASYEIFLASVHPEDRDLVDRYYKDSLERNDEKFEFEFRIVRSSDGEIRNVYEKFYHLRDSQDNVIRSIGMVHDITERKRAEKAQQQSEMNFQNLVNSAPDAIIIMKADGNISLVNAQAEKWFGYTRDELLDKPIEILIPKRHRKRHLEHRNSYFGNPSVRIMGANTELFGLRKDGSEFPIETSLSPLMTEQGLLVTAIIHDITERKQAEAEKEKLRMQLVQSQKMEAIGHLTGGIAHDFNNMLGIILGYTGMLKTITSKQDHFTTSRQSTYINEILTAGNRAKELISQMMIFSRLTPQKEQREVPSTLLQPVVKEIIQLLQSSIPSSINVNYHVEDEKLKVRIEPVQLHQILLNLVINARDSIGKYGRIGITVGKRTLTDVKCTSCFNSFSGEYVLLEVTDTGKGITDDIVTKIFDPFFTTKEVGKGTGMGLSMVHGVVHKLGGHVFVQSVPEKATSISVLLPSATEDDTDQRQDLSYIHDSDNRMLSDLRIMVIDDEQAISFMLNELLSNYGARVAVYNNPKDALDIFRRNPQAIDLVITDETMPELSGLDMAKSMLELRSDLPVILCTGYGDHVNAEIAKQHGIAGFTYKPMEINQLLELIKNTLEKERNEGKSVFNTDVD
jgi:PAS domain S-box-containing protein